MDILKCMKVRSRVSQGVRDMGVMRTRSRVGDKGYRSYDLTVA